MLPILIIVTVVFIVFGIVQVRSEEAKFMDELHRKAQAVAETVGFSARYVFESNDIKAAAATLACSKPPNNVFSSLLNTIY